MLSIIMSKGQIHGEWGLSHANLLMLRKFWLNWMMKMVDILGENGISRNERDGEGGGKYFYCTQTPILLFLSPPSCMRWLTPGHWSIRLQIEWARLNFNQSLGSEECSNDWSRSSYFMIISWIMTTYWGSVLDWMCCNYHEMILFNVSPFLQANLWIVIFSYVGNYFWTHYFFKVLGASYTFPSWKMNDASQ